MWNRAPKRRVSVPVSAIEFQVIGAELRFYLAGHLGQADERRICLFHAARGLFIGPGRARVSPVPADEADIGVEGCAVKRNIGAMEFRWLMDAPADGPDNMARDECLLHRVGAGRCPPTLRFYGWSVPTVSLGYFQRYAEFAALPPPAGGLAVVRRLTGGGAILHDRELTYCLVLPTGHPLVAEGGPNQLYDHVHQGFARVLEPLGLKMERGPRGRGGSSQRGPFFCFERHTCFDLLVEGRKIMGSAQRRTPHAVLQHGSFILENRFAQHRCAGLCEHSKTDLRSLLPQLAEAIAGTAPGGASRLTPDEEQTAEQLRGRYAESAWTRRR